MKVNAHRIKHLAVWCGIGYTFFSLFKHHTFYFLNYYIFNIN